MSRPIAIRITFDEEAMVFTATSDNLFGLFLEAETPQKLFRELDHWVPELVSDNGPPCIMWGSITFWSAWANVLFRRANRFFSVDRDQIPLSTQRG